MKRTIKMKINGAVEELLVEPWRTLADVLRDDFGLLGVKIGCDRGKCGSCTVIMNGKTVRSCLVLAPQADGMEIVTIEGLSGKDGLHPLQEAFAEHFAVQCGYCTPGMILAAKALLDKKPQATEEDVRRALEGHYCRCTGYIKIIEAVLAAEEKINSRTKVERVE